MPKSKFTPGPWKVWASKHSKDIEIQHNGEVPIVKWAGFDESFRKHSEHLANARLIAAAPELLQLCQELLGHLEAARPDLGETPLKIYARSIIDKAQ